MAAKNEGTEPLHRAPCKGLVHPFRAAALAVHRTECLGAEKPSVQLHPALAQRIIDALLRPGAEPVERERETCDSNFCHDILFLGRATSRLGPRQITRSFRVAGTKL